MTRGVIHDQDTEKHMGGCIAGFFHIFDRSHGGSSKRFFPNRIGFESTSSVGSPANPPVSVSARSSIAVSSFDYKERSKVTREIPRLSLDSLLHPRGIRTNVGGVRYDDSIDEGSETQRRSPSVVARLMGLEPLVPSYESGRGDLLEKTELRRSASESRSKDLLHCRVIEGEIREKTNGGRRSVLNSELAMKPRRKIEQKQRKGLYDYGDFFPESSVEKRLKMKGIEEPSKDLMKAVRSPRRLSIEPSPPRFQSKTATRRNLKFSSTEKLSSPSLRRNPATRRKNALNIEKQTSTGTRRVSPVHSTRTGSRKLNQTANQSPRRRKSAAEIRPQRDEDEFKKPKMDRSLIERCNKLLNNIEEMNSTSKNSIESQLSPVSVLDSSLYKEDESPSPITKPAINIKDMEDEIRSPSSVNEDPSFAYISKIVKASNIRDNSKSSIVQRRLIFDTITEIIDRNKQLSPSKLVLCESEISRIWSELQSIQKRDESEDMFEVIRGVMKRDLGRDSINGWGESELEVYEEVVDVERLIFRDLIEETIRDLKGSTESRRKLMF